MQLKGIFVMLRHEQWFITFLFLCIYIFDGEIRRIKGKYDGLVSSVALEAERVTTQSQARTYFKAPAHNLEENADEESLPVPKIKLVKDQGIVTLQTRSDASSSESDIEMDPLPPVPVVKKRVYEEIGKTFFLAF